MLARFAVKQLCEVEEIVSNALVSVAYYTQQWGRVNPDSSTREVR